MLIQYNPKHRDQLGSAVAMWLPSGSHVVAKWSTSGYQLLIVVNNCCQEKNADKQLIPMAMVATVSCQYSTPSASFIAPTRSLWNRHQHEHHLLTWLYFPRSYVIDRRRLEMSTVYLLIVDGCQMLFHPCSWYTYLQVRTHVQQIAANKKWQ